MLFALTGRFPADHRMKKKQRWVARSEVDASAIGCRLSVSASAALLLLLLLLLLLCWHSTQQPEASGTEKQKKGFNRDDRAPF